MTDSEEEDSAESSTDEEDEPAMDSQDDKAEWVSDFSKITQIYIKRSSLVRKITYGILNSNFKK